MNILARQIGQGHPCYIIAEMSANHGGSLERAMALVRAAKSAGADAIKLQTYTPDTMTLDCDNDYFRIQPGSLWEGKTLYALYREAMTPWEWHAPLQKEAERLGLAFFSTPFDETAVDFLEKLAVPAYKIASFELTDDPLLKKVGRTGKPVILSTGMSTREEIARALSVLKAAGAPEVVLLKCVSAYPAPVKDMNLRGIAELRETFKVLVGFSDHSLGETAAIASIGLGSCVLEKHLRLDDEALTPDSAFSMTPQHFGHMVRCVREAEAAVGQPFVGRTETEKDNFRFRRSLFIARDIAAGEILTAENIRVVRPGFGLPSSLQARVMGSKAGRKLVKGQPLKPEDIAGFEEGENVRFSLRPVTLDDARLLFDWKNDPAVKRSAIVRKEITWEEHVAWLNARLKDAGTVFYIIENDGQPWGQIRFDIRGNEATVSISLDKAHRSRGIGQAVLKAVCPTVMTDHLLSVVRAEISRDNTASLTSFFKAGFVLGKAEVIKGVPCFVCELRAPGSRAFGEGQG
jgi:pseudaminic acid synthase